MTAIGITEIAVLVHEIWEQLQELGLVVEGESVRTRFRPDGSGVVVEVSSASESNGFGVSTSETAVRDLVGEVLDGISTAMVDIRWSTWPPCPESSHGHPGRLVANVDFGVACSSPVRIAVECPEGRTGASQSTV